MKSKFYIVAAMMLCICIQSTFAQGTTRIAALESEIVKCLTYEGELEMRAQNPALGTIEEFEERMATLVDQTKREYAAGQRGSVTQIPIVFHVVYNTAAQNLAATYINAQLEQMNNDFRKTPGTSGDNSDPVGADTEVEFCMALRDPDGNLLAEPGINRVLYSDMGLSAPPYSDSYVENNIYPSLTWDTDKFLNVLVADLSGGLLGKAVFPAGTGLPGMPTSGGDPAKDAVMVTRTSLGSTTQLNPGGGVYAAGRTLTHEVGHWLGLRHMSGDGGCGVDDFCDDTPTSDAQNFGCLTTHISCSTVDMVQNYMDYSDDFCMNIYTADQKFRIQTVVSTARDGLGENAALACDPDATYASFSASTFSGCAGNPILFIDNSVGDNIISYSWTFGDGGTSSDQNPSHTYTNAGDYTVTLTINDGAQDYMTTREVAINETGVFDHLNGGTLWNEMAANEGGSSGWVGGHNSFGDLAKVEYFAEGADGAKLGDVEITFAIATSGPGVNLRCILLDGVSGSPGSELASVNVAIPSILTDGSATTVDFGEPTLNGPFFVGVELDYGDGSEVAVFTNHDGDTNPTTAWEQWGDDSWHSFNDGTGNTWQWDASLAITAEVLCDGGTAPVAPVAEFSSDVTTVCAGSSVSFTDESTNDPNLWAWNFGDGGSSNTASPSHIYADAGTYTVTLTASNAAGSDSETKASYISVEPFPASFAGNASLNTTCQGQSVDLSMTGTFSATYSWESPTAVISNTSTATVTPSFTTTYTAVCDDGVCHAESEVTITVNPLPSTPSISNVEGTLAASSGSGGTWQWYLDGDPIANATSSTYVPTVDGDYQAEITDNNGCVRLSAIRTVVLSAVIDQMLDASISLYPNPVADQLTVEVTNYQFRDVSLTLIDVAGRELQAFELDAPIVEIDMRTYSEGVYFLQVETKEGRLAVRKIVKQQ